MRPSPLDDATRRSARAPHPRRSSASSRPDAPDAASPPHAAHPRRERGVVIVWLALFLLTILGFVAIGVDLAKLHAARTQLQNAADAAALAGASAIDPATGTIVAATAITRAQQTGAANTAFIDDSQPVNIAAGDIVVTSNTCQVTARRDGDNSIVTYFANVLGIPNLQMTATATAKLDTASGVGCGLAPLIALAAPGVTFQYGCSNFYQLKYGGGTGYNGNYGAVQVPSCAQGDCAGMGPPGANTYRCMLEHGYCCDVKVGDVLTTETGNMSGPTKQAIDALFAADVVQTQNICYSDYLAAGGNGSRVLTVPVTTDSLPNGSGLVTVTGIAQFFLRAKVGNGTAAVITAEFVRAIASGYGGGGGNGVVTFALRLVQ